MNMKNDLYDVIIYNIKNRIVESIAGSNMKRDTGHFNAEKRLETVSTRLNEEFNVDIVPAGKYKKGDKFND